MRKSRKTTAPSCIEAGTAEPVVRFATIPGLTVGSEAVSWAGGRLAYSEVANLALPGTLRSTLGYGLNPYAWLLHAVLVDEGGVVLQSDSGREVRFHLKNALRFPGQGRRIRELRQLKQILRERTFPYRLQRYERSLWEKGWFRHGDYTFHLDGSLQHRGKRRLDLRDPGLKLIADAQGADLGPALMIGPLMVDLINNGDCLLAILLRVYELSVQLR